MNEYEQYIEKDKKTDIIIRSRDHVARFFGTFDNIDENTLSISIPRANQPEFNYLTGQNIELHIYTHGGIFKLECKLIRCTVTGCIVSPPHNVEKIQRREFIRVDMPTKSILKLHSPQGIKKIEAFSRNISAKGINFSLNEDISRYSKVEAEILFAEKNIKTLCHVVKAQSIQVNKETVFDTSLMFITISQKEIDFIVKKCFEYEAQKRRKLLEAKE